MLEFREITLADKPWMQGVFRSLSGAMSEEFNFTFCFIWKDILGYRVAQYEDLVLVKSISHGPSYLFPAGAGDIKAAIEALRADSEQCGHPLKLYTALPEQVKLLETLYGADKVHAEPSTDYFDYIYDAQSLITLAGKKLHSKRNHINRFKAEYPDWSYESITPQNMPEVLEMNAEWCRINECGSNKHLQDEACSVKCMLAHFFDLDVSGGLIRAGGRVVAFSVGDQLTSSTYLVHIEKAFSDVQGAYTIINQQFAEHNCMDYQFMNREDDSGQEGLRKAKQSYRPVMMAEKYRVTID